MYTDKTLTCADCGQQFVFTASEQDFYAQRGFSEPRRCASCRASRKAARGNGGGGYGASSSGGGGYSGRAATARAAAVATAVAAATGSASAARARCSRRPAAIAARKPWSRSDPPAASRFIAATASGACAAPDPHVSGALAPQPRTATRVRQPDPGRFMFRGYALRDDRPVVVHRRRAASVGPCRTTSVALASAAGVVALASQSALATPLAVPARCAAARTRRPTT